MCGLYACLCICVCVGVRVCLCVFVKVRAVCVRMRAYVYAHISVFSYVRVLIDCVVLRVTSIVRVIYLCVCVYGLYTCLCM